MLKRILGAVVAGLALTLAFEPFVVPVVIPFAVAGFALVTRGLRARSAWVPALVFGVSFYFTHIWWMRDSIGPDAWLGLSTLEALFYGLLGGVAAVLHPRRWWPLWLACAWVTMEVIRSGWPFSGMPWGRLAFGVIDTPVAPSLAYVGAVGVSFLLALAGMLIAQIVVGPSGGRRVPAVCLAAVVAVTALPVLIPWTPHRSGEAVVAAVQGDVPGPGNNILYDSDQVTANHVDATVALAARVAAGEEPQPDFVIWPENSTASDPFRRQDLNAGITRAVEEIDAPVLVGAIVDGGEKYVYNQGIVWDPVTGPGERYTKQNPVPFGEYIPFRSFVEKVLDGNLGQLAAIPRDMVSGDRVDPLTLAGVPVADAICFDIAYDGGLQAQIDNGAELLVVQTSNASFIFTDQVEQQFAITRLRAIETGRWVVVASTNGVTGVISPDGTVVDRTKVRTQDVLVETVGLTTDVTPGTRLAPWIGRVSIAVTVLMLLLGGWQRFRGRLTYPQPLEEDPAPVTTPDRGPAAPGPTNGPVTDGDRQ